MTALFSRQAERFADAVDGTRPNDPSIDPLLSAVDRLRAAPQPSPREDFRSALRARLMLEAEATLTPRAASTSGRVPAQRTPRKRRRALVAAAAVLALVGGTAGVAVAAQGAHPGDLLYPIKRAIERIEAAFTPGQSQQGATLLDQADTRLMELASMEGPEYGSDAVVGIDDFTDEAQRGSDLLLSSYPTTGDSGSVTTVREFARRTMDQLAALEDSSGGALTEELASAALTIQQIDARAVALCPSCSDLPPVQVPDSLLTIAAPPGIGATLPGTEVPTASPVQDSPSAPASTAPRKHRKKSTSGTTSGSGTKSSPTSAPSPSTSSPLDPVTSNVTDAVSDAVSGAVDQATDLLSTAVALPGL